MEWAARAFVALSLLLHVVTVFHNKKQAEVRPGTGQGWPGSAPLDSLPSSHASSLLGGAEKSLTNAQPRASWLTEGTNLASVAKGRRLPARRVSEPALALPCPWKRAVSHEGHQWRGSDPDKRWAQRAAGPDPG